VEAVSSGQVALDSVISEGVRGAPDVGAIASLEGKKLCVLLWHYHDDDQPGADARIELHVSGLPTKTKTLSTLYRVDETHSNATTEWKNLGSPPAPNDSQYARIRKAGELAADGDAPGFAGDTVEILLPRQGVSLAVIDWN
jgi:xylan 1,4-beta-xylosidase